MPSPDAGSIDLPIQVFGGRVTQFDSQALPAGASPFDQDVIFSGGNSLGEISVGGVGSRPGMLSLYAPFAGNPAINYIRTFVDSTGNPHQLILDSLGILRDDFPEATFTTFGTVVAAAFAQSDTYAGKEWLAIGDGKFGIDLPRQYDGTNFDRVSQCGPGAAPSIADENNPFTIAAAGVPGAQMMAAGAIASASEVGFLCTIVLTAGTFGFLTGNPGLNAKAGDQVTIAGVGAGYNGIQTLAADVVISANVNQPITFFSTTSGLPSFGAGGTAQFPYAVITFTTNQSAGQNLPLNTQAAISGVTPTAYNGTWRVAFSSFPGVGPNTIIVAFQQFGVANGGAGSASIAGNISAGKHQVSLCFQFRDQSISVPAPPQAWTAGGLKRAIASGIATGPPNVIARILIFTPVITSPATTGPFFYFSSAVPTPTAGNFPSMVIQDNATTSLTVDFLDSVLQSATAASNLFNLLELGECSATIVYSERTFWSGERNKVNSAGGGGGFNNLTFDGGFTPTAPQSYPLGWAQGGSGDTGGRKGTGGDAVWGFGYTILGDGATNQRGLITQSAAADYLGVPILKPGTSYSVRVRLLQLGITQGNFVVEIFSPSLGSLGNFTVALPGAVTGVFKEFSGLLLASQATIPADAVIRIYTSGTVNNGGQLDIDCLEPYPTLQPINRTILRASYAFQPSAFDGTTGFEIVGKDNGQAIRCGFKLLDKKLYIVKERSLYGTQDDGSNEPSLWASDSISQTVGTPSVNGVATAGEAWAVIVSHDGLYIFWGAQPVKISQEIQPDWDTINWNAGQAIWTVIDQQNKRIHVGVPTGSSIVPNSEFVLDYSQLNDAEDIAANPQAHYAYFNPTNVVAPGRARKWTVWNLSNNSGALTYRADGSYHLLRGNAAGNGKIYDQVSSQTTDDGATINAIYQTYYFPDRMEEIQLQLGAHGKTFKFLTGYIAGTGKVTWSVHGAQDNRVIPLTTLTLRSPDKWNFEMNANFESERSSLIFASSGNGAAFHLSYLAPTIQRSIARSVRGVA